MPYYCKKPETPLEKLAANQACVFRPSLWQPVSGTSYGPFGATCSAPVTDVFGASLDQDFSIDGPVFAALVPQLASKDPEGLATLLAVTFPAPGKLSPEQADQNFSKLLSAFQESTVGGGNVLGNVAASAEAALRAAWRRQAAQGFKDLVSGKVVGSVKLSPHVTIESSRIGAGGDLRKGARLTVRVRGLPVKVVHKLDPIFIPKSSGNAAAIHVGARDLQRMESAAVSVANARAASSRAIRYANKAGGAALAFGPSAGIDFYDSYNTKSGGTEIAKDFAVRSAKSQSGNVLGMAATAGIVAVGGIVGVVGAPAILIGLGVGIFVQTAWGYKGGDEWIAGIAKDLVY